MENLYFAALRQKGWILRDTLVTLALYADWDAERLADLAQELVRQRMDVILCNGDQAALAAAQASTSIPIVFFSVNFPVELGLIESFPRPGRNVTGISVFTGPEVTHKRLGLLRELLPTAQRLSWLWPWDELPTIGSFNPASTAKAVANSLGFETRFHSIHSPQDIDTAFDDIIKWDARAVMGSGIPVFRARQRVADLLLHHHLPGAFHDREFTDAGALFSYGSTMSAGYATARLAEYVDRILRGTSPAELPVERPSAYELILNLRTAKELGLRVPRSFLARADEIID